MRDGVVHTVGYLNNRQDPIKLGQVTEQDPTVSFLKVAQNIDIDDRGVATTRDGQEERYLGAVSSLWVHPQDDTIAYLLEKVVGEAGPNAVVNGTFDTDVSGWTASGTPTVVDGKYVPEPGTTYLYAYQNVPVTSGIPVTFSIDMAQVAGAITAYVYDGAYGAGVLQEVLSASGPEQTYSLSFTPETSTVGILLYSPDDGANDGSYDNVEVRESASPDTNMLKKFNTDFTTTDIALLNSDADISYAIINGLVFLSNGVDIGYIENGAFVPFSQALLRDELPMPAGEYIAYLDNEGVLLVASGSVVYRSKPWNPQVRDARFSEFPMNGKVRMLATVEDGWFVATEKNVSFAQMDDADGYSFRHITDSVPPDGAFYKEFHFDEDKGRDSQMRVIWASPNGFIEGTSGGGYENHSYPNVALPTGNKGKVFNRNANGTNQYLAVISNPEDDDNYVAPTLLKNRITP